MGFGDAGAESTGRDSDLARINKQMVDLKEKFGDDYKKTPEYKDLAKEHRAVVTKSNQDFSDDVKAGKAAVPLAPCAKKVGGACLPSCHC